ncbi:MAG: hypothetical protein ACJ8DI_25635 [Ktedonobacteraceae bacterium]
MSEEQSPKKKKSERPLGSIIPDWSHFGSTNDQENDTPAEQEANTAVERQTSTPARQDTSMPVNQLTSTTVEQEASLSVHQQAGIPAGQQDSTPAFIKGTYYITPEHDMKLERIRLARRIKGQRIDKSALIREAIDLLQE